MTKKSKKNLNANKEEWIKAIKEAFNKVSMDEAYEDQGQLFKRRGIEFKHTTGNSPHDIREAKERETLLNLKSIFPRKNIH